MNILLHRDANIIKIDGVTYKVIPSFSLYIRLNILLNNNKATVEDLINLMREFCPTYKFNGNNYLMFFEKMMSYYNASTEKLNTINCHNDTPIIDFEMDKNIIFADFIREYNINLMKDNIHIYEFLALLSGLSDTSGLKKRIYYRTVNTNTLKGEDKKRCEMLKQQYKIGIATEIENLKDWLKSEDERIKTLKKQKMNKATLP